MIKFLGPRSPKPHFDSSKLPPISRSSVAASSSTTASSIGKVGTTPKGSGIDESQLPLRFRRRLIDQEEITAINKKKSVSKSPSRRRSNSIQETPPSRPSSSKFRPSTQSGASFDGKEKEGATQDEIIQKLLLAIEFSKDELATIVLCRLLRGYAVACKDPIGQRRLRRLVRLDAANHCLRAMRPIFQDQNPSPLQIMAIDALSLALIHVSAKDRKITLKVRLAGLIPFLVKRIEEADRLWATSTLLKLICRCCLRSVRNAQAMGREKNFAEKLVAVLSAYNSIELRASTEATAFASGTTSSMSYETTSQTLLPFDGNSEFEVMAAANEAALKMARLVEILFLAAKNKRNKSVLIDRGVIPVLVKVYNSHFERRYVEVIHLEIAFITIASFRQLIKIKKGKEELINLNGLGLCESSIRSLREEKNKDLKPFQVTALVQLQDSLCALCMRCLPATPFPMPKRPFPLKYPLPSDRSTLASRAAANRKEQNSSLYNRTLRNSLTKSPQKSPVKNRVPQTKDGLTDAADSAVDDVSPSSDSESTGKDGNDGSMISYSSQKISELNGNYHHMFAELESGAFPKDLSPKQRKLLPGSDLREISFEHLTKEKHQITLSVGDFVKIPFPDLYEMDMDLQQQDLLSNPESMREAMIGEMARFRLENQFPQKVVFDLDRLITAQNIVKSSTNLSNPRSPKQKIRLENNDLERIGHLDQNCNHLKFESRFESGNLRRAIQVADYHYELIISPDINQRSSHYQWFYFEVSNNKANVPYTFEIINCLKKTSMFSHGMQPVLFSVTEAQKGRPGWVRAGSSVCYYRNLYTPRSDSSTDDSDPVVSDKPKKKQRRSSESSSGKDKEDGQDAKGYFSTRFTIKFRHNADICYIAYHYPYTYSFLQATLERVLSHVDPQFYFRQDKLATSIRGNSIPLLTITSPGSPKEIDSREIVVYSARVHPGEANSSWIMHGLIKFLMSNSREASKLRDNFVFKIIPMLNPDGVINGSHRCSLAGTDLNRVWDRPNAALHPTIYHAKGLIQYMVDVLHKKPFVFVDLHGHSTKPNVFMFGNNPEESWRMSDHSTIHNHQYIILPEYVSQISNGFSLRECRFNIAKSKESSARVTLWRQFGIERSYTMESTYCGFDVGPYAGKQIGITEHNEMGQKLVEALLLLKNYTEGVAALPNGMNPEPPPAPVFSSPIERTSTGRRRSLGTTSIASRPNFRRSNTFKSTTSLNK
ncbi:hypothetical protein FO519_009416 [Halicephalobus sp. NKZ332]|nr:hypothetical protein FO519_009416 [Halicephalobus sp. NKZ332]